LADTRAMWVCTWCKSLVAMISINRGTGRCPDCEAIAERMEERKDGKNNKSARKICTGS
jgi:rubrerythrin